MKLNFFKRLFLLIISVLEKPEKQAEKDTIQESTKADAVETVKHTEHFQSTRKTEYQKSEKK